MYNKIRFPFKEGRILIKLTLTVLRTRLILIFCNRFPRCGDVNCHRRSNYEPFCTLYIDGYHTYNYLLIICRYTNHNTKIRHYN